MEGGFQEKNEILDGVLEIVGEDLEVVDLEQWLFQRGSLKVVILFHVHLIALRHGGSTTDCRSDATMISSPKIGFW